MKKVSYHFVSLILSVFLMGSSSTIITKTELEHTTNIHGIVLATYAEPYYLIQNDKYIYRINYNRLSDELRVLLKNKTEGKVNINIPINAIDIAWEYKYYEKLNKPALTNLDNKKLLQQQIKTKNGILSLTGKLLPQFNEPHYFILTNDYIFRINSAKANLTEKKLLQTTGIISTFKFPSDAVDFVWMIDQETPKEKNTRIKTRQPIEYVKIKDGSYLIYGKVLPSFSDSSYLIQANKEVFQIPKSKLDTKKYKKLNEIGSSISLLLPKDDIEISWNSDETSRKNNSFLK